MVVNMDVVSREINEDVGFNYSIDYLIFRYLVRDDGVLDIFNIIIFVSIQVGNDRVLLSLENMSFYFLYFRKSLCLILRVLTYIIYLGIYYDDF